MLPPYVYLSPVPIDESCEQAGMPGYSEERAQAECRAYAAQLRRLLTSNEFDPEDVELRVVGQPHDVGVSGSTTYYEVFGYVRGVAGREALDWLEENEPLVWDAEACTELHLEEEDGPVSRFSNHAGNPTGTDSPFRSQQF